MKLLLDNTFIHQLSGLLFLDKKKTFIDYHDFIAIINFIEHLLFSNKIEVVSFSEDKISKITHEFETSFISRYGSNPEIHVINYNLTEAAKTSEKAVQYLLQDIVTLDINILKECGKLCTNITRPYGHNKTGFEKWFQKDWTIEERSELKEKSLYLKGNGLCDYMICSNDSLYNQLKILFPSKSKSDVILSNGLNIFFRVAINQARSQEIKSTYCPSPQRTEFIQRGDYLFRSALEKKILKIILLSEVGKAQTFLKSLKNNEVVPLPLFAFHFLRNAKCHSIPEIIDYAINIREEKDVKYIRNWLNKMQIKYQSVNYKERFKAMLKIESLAKDIELDINNNPFKFFSILRGDISISDTGIDIKPDIPESVNTFYSLITKYSRRRLFLANLTRNILATNDFGSEAINFLGNSIKIKN